MGANLAVRDSAALTSLSGLDALSNVDGYLELGDNDALTSLSGLGALTSVGWYFSVHDSAALVSLSGVDSLTTVGTGVYVAYNELLCEDEVDELVAQLVSFGGVLTNTANTGTCTP